MSLKDIALQTQYPVPKKIWLTFSNVCDKDKFKVTLEINGKPFREFYTYVGQDDGIICESWNLTWLLKGKSWWKFWQTKPGDRGLFMWSGFGVLTGIFLFVILAIYSYRHLNDQKECLESKKAVEIGGCDAGGKCSVTYEDGTFGTQWYPGRGQYFCTKRE